MSDEDRDDIERAISEASGYMAMVTLTIIVNLAVGSAITACLIAWVLWG